MTLLSDRQIELLRMAMHCFEECYSPFDLEVLVKHHITADECYALSQQVGLAISVLLELLKNKQYYPIVSAIIDNIKTETKKSG